MSRRQLPQWKRLEAHAESIAGRSLHTLFEQDRARTSRWQASAPHLRVDYSRQIATEETVEALLDFARRCGVERARDALFDGERVNVTENRPAWHTALRTPPADSAVARMVSDQREEMLALAERLRASHRQGSITNVIVIGIGGSDLGPRLVVQGLGRPSGPKQFFINNLDPLQLAEAFELADPAQTAVIVISKSFTTLETLENLTAIRAWLKKAGTGESLLFAVTAAPKKAISLGVSTQNVLEFPDWVGGRFSVWSACGLPIAIAHGSDANSCAFLVGAAEADDHFVPLRCKEMFPCYSRCSMCGTPPSCASLRGQSSRTPSGCSLLPAYLQQLEMESCGKRVDLEGNILDYATSPVLWGDVGTTAQHSVFQFMHQGTSIAPADFVLVEAMRGSSEQRETPARRVRGSPGRRFGVRRRSLARKPARGRVLRPCPRIAPFHASVDGPPWRGRHRRISRYAGTPHVCQRGVWGINAFDQWGVEIGKKLLAHRR
jgi:glucose-6-phosphate isomerase